MYKYKIGWFDLSLVIMLRKKINFLTNLGHSIWTALNINMIFNIWINKVPFHEPNLDFCLPCLFIYDVCSQTRVWKLYLIFQVDFPTWEVSRVNFASGKVVILKSDECKIKAAGSNQDGALSSFFIISLWRQPTKQQLVSSQHYLLPSPIK